MAHFGFILSCLYVMITAHTLYFLTDKKLFTLIINASRVILPIQRLM